MARQLYRIECDPACAFSVQSHEEQEVLDMAQDHVKNKHHMETSEEDMRARIMAV
jgi:predicted small metal-binding protein